MAATTRLVRPSLLLPLAVALALGACSGGGASGQPPCTPAAEACNGRDDDCDGAVDDGFDVGAACAVGVGACRVAGLAACAAGGAATTCAATPGAPGAEACNGADDDCDGQVDEALEGCCTPAATQGCGVAVGACATGTQTCSAARAWGPCLDGGGAPVTLPGQRPEACNGADDDCDGLADEEDAAGCSPFFPDVDRDGAGAGQAACLCAPAGDHSALQDGDCDDARAATRPGAPEACNGIDDDCDGQADQGLAGCCAPGATQACGTDTGACTAGTATCGEDRAFGACLEPGGAPALLPGAATEGCNGLDDDCDGATDEPGALGCTTWYADQDGDGAGGGPGSCRCGPEGGFVSATGTDCDDADPTVRPGAAEACNGRDDDCDGLVDEGAPDCCTPAATLACGATVGRCVAGTQTCSPARTWGACLDGGGAPVTLPGTVAEACDGADDDCDGLVDEEGASGCTPRYADADGDLFGTGAARCLCAPLFPWTTTQPLDCDDTRPEVNPSGLEACNGRDDDCDGLVDEEGAAGATLLFADADGDGWGTGAGRRLCAPAGLFTATRAGDCDDGVAAVNPAAAEACNGRDDDCDAAADEAGAAGCATYFVDQDRDGFGAGAGQCLCAAAPPRDATAAGDCADDSAAVNPAAAETCDGLDDDCDGTTDVPAALLCPAPANATAGACGGAAGCAVGACAAGWHDVNGGYADGCECQAAPAEGAADNGTCETANTVGAIGPAGGTLTVTGTLLPAGDTDFQRFTVQAPFLSFLGVTVVPTTLPAGMELCVSQGPCGEPQTCSTTEPYVSAAVGVLVPEPFVVQVRAIATLPATCSALAYGLEVSTF